MRFSRIGAALVGVSALCLGFSRGAEARQVDAPEGEALEAEAPPPALAFPLGCDLGQTCWIALYPDASDGEVAGDFACGSRARAGDGGVTIALGDLVDVIAGAPVRAAAAGEVALVSDAAEDRLALSETERAAVAESPCGNQVTIEHADGWSTTYCHLRLGSIAVSPGDRVEAGQKIALAGVSGDTQFPNLHFEVRRDGRAIDPFTGRAAESGCAVLQPDGAGDQAGDEAEVEAGLWNEPTPALDYVPGLISRVGFATRAPSIDGAVLGEYRAQRVSSAAAVLVGWAEVYGSRAGDFLALRLLGPDGFVVVETVDFALEDGTRRFASVGAPKPEGGWPTGVYNVEATLLRDGQAISARSGEIALGETDEPQER